MKIACFVIFCHLILIATLIYLQSPPSTTTSRRLPLAVKTHLLGSTPQSPPQPTSISKSTPKPKTAGVNMINKPTVKKEKKTARSKENPNQEKLISMMHQSLATLNTTASTSQPATPMKPNAIGKLTSETLSFEAKYEEELVLYLESLLSFPENGEVKLRLTLRREGSVQKIAILSSTSERNGKYIEATLATYSFPPFCAHYKGESTHTFTLTLTNL